MNRSAPSSSNGTSSPKPSKSRLPVSSASTRPANSQLASARVTESSLLTPSPSPLRIPKSPSARLRTISRSSGSSSPQPSPSPSDRTRTKSMTKAPPRTPRTRAAEEIPAPPKTPALSVKEAIALKRAEAKKAMAAQKTTATQVSSAGAEDANPFTLEGSAADGDDLGRLSVRETIQRARSSGSLNIASRDLPCLPSALFELHLSVTPDKLASVPEEPPLPEKPSKRATSTTWYDQQDLTFLRARNNQIVEIQHEISLFGSLKTIDLQHNRLASLPESIADLASLSNLDLSHNALTSLPTQFFALPSLSVLDISHNSFIALPFNMPFEPVKKSTESVKRSNDFYSAPEIVRATRPLPRLTSLDVSHNKIVASAIDKDAIPQDLKTFNLTYNPLGNAAELLASLSAVAQLVELRMSKCDIDDTSFPTSLLSPSADAQPFPKLAILDLEETRATKDSVSAAFSAVAQTIDFEAPVDDPRKVRAGTLAVAVGKRIVREEWEIEADRQAQRLLEKRSAVNLRAAAAASTSATTAPPLPPPKSQWEIEAEQGLLSEGAQRRARAEAAQRAADEAAAEAAAAAAASARDTPMPLDRYWDAASFTLTLPPSTGRSARAGAGTATTDTLSRVTLPLALIAPQSFANTLRVLELRGRRAEPAFVLPPTGYGPLLPHLETLNLEGCALSDAVPGAQEEEGGTLRAFARLFPSLRNLELAYNDLTGAAMTRETLEPLLFAGGEGEGKMRAGLRRLCLCGNKIGELEGLRELARVVFGEEGDDDERRKRWTLEELDVRENAIAVLAGELGLLPLEIFLVDGNLFRVPPRRVWEREGTKGLLTWLRGRLGY